MLVWKPLRTCPRREHTLGLGLALGLTALQTHTVRINIVHLYLYLYLWAGISMGRYIYGQVADAPYEPVRVAVCCVKAVYGPYYLTLS